MSNRKDFSFRVINTLFCRYVIIKATQTPSWERGRSRSRRTAHRGDKKARDCTVKIRRITYLSLKKVLKPTKYSEEWKTGYCQGNIIRSDGSQGRSECTFPSGGKVRLEARRLKESCAIIGFGSELKHLSP